MTREKLEYYIIRDFVGYGPIDTLMGDARIEDVSCDGVGIALFIFHQKYESIKTSVMFADEDVLETIETRVEDRTLHVGFKPRSRIWSSGEVTVSIQTPELHAVAGSGGAIVRATFTRWPDCAIAASGGSEVHVRGLDARQLAVEGSGGAILDVSGRADQLELQLSGGSHFDARQFEARNVDVQGSGGSVAELRASGKVRGALSGGSEMHVRGGARASVATSGGSELSVDD